MGAPWGSEQFFKNYEMHNEWVRKLFRDSPDRLLPLNLEDDDSIENMQKFCKFVGANATVCSEPFPHENVNPNSKAHNFIDWDNIDDDSWEARLWKPPPCQKNHE